MWAWCPQETSDEQIRSWPVHEPVAERPGRYDLPPTRRVLGQNVVRAEAVVRDDDPGGQGLVGRNAGAGVASPDPGREEALLSRESPLRRAFFVSVVISY